MGVIIKEIKIPDESYSFKSEGGRNDVLQNLSKINIFVGENNSGKSRFLRLIFSNNNLEFKPFNKDFEKINENIEKLKKNIQEFFEPA